MMNVPQITFALAEIPSYAQHIETNALFFDLTFARNIIFKLVRPSRWSMLVSLSFNFMLTNLTVPSIMVAWGTIQIDTSI